MVDTLGVFATSLYDSNERSPFSCTSYIGFGGRVLINVHHLSAILLIVTVLPTQPFSPAPKLFVVTFKIEIASSHTPGTDSSRSGPLPSSTPDSFLPSTCSPFLLVVRWIHSPHSVISNWRPSRYAVSTAAAIVLFIPWAENAVVVLCRRIGFRIARIGVRDFVLTELLDAEGSWRERNER